MTGIATVSTTTKEPLIVLEGQGCEAGNSLLTPPDYQPEMVLARKEVRFLTFSDITGNLLLWT